MLSISFACGSLVGKASLETAPDEVFTPTPTPINPQAVLDQSGAAMNSLESFHFELRHNNGGTPLARDLILISADGYVVKPDKLTLDFTGSVGNFAMRGSLITIDGLTFMTNPLNDEWQVLKDQVSPLAYFDPAEGISGMMSQVESPTLLEVHSDEVHIGGRIPATALSTLFGATVDGSIDVALTIDLHEFYLTKVVLDGRITETELDGVVRTIVLDQFNEPTVIEPPE